MSATATTVEASSAATVEASSAATVKATAATAMETAASISAASITTAVSAATIAATSVTVACAITAAVTIAITATIAVTTTEPGASADKEATVEPGRPIVAVRSAGIRRVSVITVFTDRSVAVTAVVCGTSDTDAYRNLCVRLLGNRRHQEKSKC